MASALDGLLVVYFVIHAVLAVVVDAQMVAGPWLYQYYAAAGVTKVVADWVKDEGDFLVGEKAPWFIALIWSELLLQVPACCWLARKWIAKDNAARVPAILYSCLVLASMVPIYSTLVADPRPTLVCKGVYAIWIALPLLLLLRSAASPLFPSPADAEEKRLPVPSPQFSRARKVQSFTKKHL